MSEEELQRTMNKRVPGLYLILFVFGAIEFAILMVCLAFSTNQDMVTIYSPDNEIIYENSYNLSHINEFKQLYGIDDFNNSGFVLTRIKKENRFPTRTWIALSVSTPLLLILFTAFIIKAFDDMFQKKETRDNKQKQGKENGDFEETKFEKLFSTLGRLNIYSLGSTIIIAVFLYWMVPDLIVYIGKIGYQTIAELKWVILALVISVGAFMILKTILSHKTKTEIIRQQAEIQKNRDQLAMKAKLETKLLEQKDK